MNGGICCKRSGFEIRQISRAKLNRYAVGYGSGYPVAARLYGFPGVSTFFEKQHVSVSAKAAAPKAVAHDRVTMTFVENYL